MLATAVFQSQHIPWLCRPRRQQAASHNRSRRVRPEFMNQTCGRELAGEGGIPDTRSVALYQPLCQQAASHNRSRRVRPELMKPNLWEPACWRGGQDSGKRCVVCTYVLASKLAPTTDCGACGSFLENWTCGRELARDGGVPDTRSVVFVPAPRQQAASYNRSRRVRPEFMNQTCGSQLAGEGGRDSHDRCVVYIHVLPSKLAPTTDCAACGPFLQSWTCGRELARDGGIPDTRSVVFVPASSPASCLPQ